MLCNCLYHFSRLQEHNMVFKILEMLGERVERNKAAINKMDFESDTFVKVKFNLQKIMYSFHFVLLRIII
jgi:hypothetical protein